MDAISPKNHARPAIHIGPGARQSGREEALTVPALVAHENRSVVESTYWKLMGKGFGLPKAKPPLVTAEAKPLAVKA